MDNLSGWCKSERRLEGFTIIVTGSNTGVGRETAADLYRRGARVIMACRNIVLAKEAKEDIEQCSQGQPGTGELVVEELDLSSLESVRAFCARVTSRAWRLRGVVCNAGVFLSPDGRTRDGFETHLASNHLGHALLTLLLLPTLIQSAPSRIVFVSSLFHQFYELDLDDINLTRAQYTPLQAYSNSKTAIILFAKALDRKLKEHEIQGVSTYSLHPGIVKTDIGRHLPSSIWGMVTLYVFENFLLNWCWKTPRCGAQTSIYCAVDEECENESGFYYSDCAKNTPSEQCQSESEAEKLWNVTMKLLNLQDYDPFRQDSSKQLDRLHSKL